jgi:hypothetical protein
MMRARAGFITVSLGMIAAACGHGAVPGSVVLASSSACTRVDTSAAMGLVPPERIAGEYRLSLVATHGPRQGRSIAGTMTLGTHYGHAAIALDSVGAVAAGSIASRDSTRPGVLVLSAADQAAGMPQTYLRLGAEANRTDIRLLDGAYMVLIVDSASASAMRGHWRSGIRAETAGGYFCADRR